MAQKEEEMDELLLEAHSLLTGLSKDELYEICIKLGTIPESRYANKSRLATVKVVVEDIEKQISKCNETEKVAFVRDVLTQVTEIKSATSVGEEQQTQDSIRQTLEKEITWLKEKLQREMEALNDQVSAIKMTTGDNVQTGAGAATSEVNYRGLQSICKRDFRIVGTVGAKGQKDQLSYFSLSRQIQSGKERGYSKKKLVDGLIKCIVPGLPLKDYLEAMHEIGLETIMKLVCAHYQEKNASKLYASLTNLAQSPADEPQTFLLRALNLREKIIFASKQEGSKLKYDTSQCQSMFLHAIETGLLSNTLRTRMRPHLQRPDVTDAELIAQLNLAGAEESQRNAKLGIGQMGKTKVMQVSAEDNSKLKTGTPKKGKEAKAPFAEKLLLEIQAIKTDIAALKQDVRFTCAQSHGEESKMPRQGKGRPRRENRRGCKECYKKGVGDECTHCWKCGDSSHFAYNCPGRKGPRRGNCPRLLSRDSQ